VRKFAWGKREQAWGKREMALYLSGEGMVGEVSGENFQGRSAQL
jgi:hypothetical protein